MEDVLKEEEIPFRESLVENVSCSRVAFNSLNYFTYFYLYPDLFNDFILQEDTQCSIQMNSIGLTYFEVIDGSNVHMEDREHKVSSLELNTTMPYHHFSWDEGNVVEYVFHTISSFVSTSYLINRESYCSSSHLLDIVESSGSHHFFEDMSHNMVDASACISFDFTNLPQVEGCPKCESMEVCQENEALRSTPMVMSGPHSFGLSSRINNFIRMKSLSSRTLYINSMHDSHLAC